MGDITGDTRLQSRILEDVGAASHYRAWLVSLALDALGDEPVEIGSGHGDYAAEWLPHARSFTATDADESRVAFLKERFAGDSRVRVRKLLLPSTLDGGFSSAVAYNVLEHIPDDVAALRSMAAMVRPGGAVIVFVPAFPLLMSDFDRAVGHVRRYRRASLRKAFEDAGLRPRVLKHVNWAGFFAWLLMMRLLRGVPRDSLALRTYDRLIVPAVRASERLMAPPFGQSLLAIADV
ncbi:methyltransferase [Actinorhabdospora filicis]|uniref:Methyltransferase n=1 Tax=Actinorhabdospora filicis TaxID=1785913 RepID=A0A9W6SSX2_9ACTN|nr:class I SAM-dependent methyltransferase [Actinorhabdospora filicis]GLZ81369.1 methyltransferase [Actinorhabdospora filicis]